MNGWPREPNATDDSTSRMWKTLAPHAKSRGIRVVMISGSPDQMETAEEKADQLLPKPFSAAELERAMQHALASETFGRRGSDPTQHHAPSARHDERAALAARGEGREPRAENPQRPRVRCR